MQASRRPFLWCTARLRQQWNIRHSIIDAFATFFLLSYITLLNVSRYLLAPTSVHNARGSLVGYFLYYDATVEYMGPDHRPYAVLAILVVVGVLFPLVLLLLYPMLWFQKCLNRCGLNSPGLQMFMQCFQGYYRDRTDGGRECRYFAAVYPACRIAAYVMGSTFLSSIFSLVYIVICATVITAIVFVSPYKQPYEGYKKLDVAMTFSIGAILIGLLFVIDSSYVSTTCVGYTFCVLFSLTPLVYFTIKSCLLIKDILVQRWYSDSGRGDYENLINIITVN